MRFGKQTKHRMLDLFDALKSAPTEYDQRLLDLEAKLLDEHCDEEYYNAKRSDRKRPYTFDLHDLKVLCSQQLTWQQIADKLGDTPQRVRDIARANGITKERMPRGKKLSATALTNSECVRRYYEKNSPSVEELDRLMVLYGGYIGILAYKLNKTFAITKNMLRHRGRYQTWKDYFKNGGKYDFFNK